jgi:cephalosporin-C deacetylase-like acetyl esterase
MGSKAYEEVKALREEYERLFAIYWDARTERMERARQEVEESLVDIKAPSNEAYRVYMEARHKLIEARNRRIYERKKK